MVLYSFSLTMDVEAVTYAMWEKQVKQTPACRHSLRFSEVIAERGCLSSDAPTGLWSYNSLPLQVHLLICCHDHDGIIGNTPADKWVCKQLSLMVYRLARQRY